MTNPTDHTRPKDRTVTTSRYDRYHVSDRPLFQNTAETLSPHPLNDDTSRERHSPHNAGTSVQR